MDQNRRPGCIGCVFTFASLLGLAAGILTFLVYYNSGADSLLAALAEVRPEFQSLLASSEEQIEQFVLTWPFAPWVGAVIIYAIIFGLRILAEEGFNLFTMEVTTLGLLVQVFSFLPLALLWLWVFSGAVSRFALAVFFGGYMLSIVVATLRTTDSA